MAEEMLGHVQTTDVKKSYILSDFNQLRKLIQRFITINWLTVNFNSHTLKVSSSTTIPVPGKPETSTLVLKQHKKRDIWRHLIRKNWLNFTPDFHFPHTTIHRIFSGKYSAKKWNCESNKAFSANWQNTHKLGLYKPQLQNPKIFSPTTLIPRLIPQLFPFPWLFRGYLSIPWLIQVSRFSKKVATLTTRFFIRLFHMFPRSRQWRNWSAWHQFNSVQFVIYIAPL